MVNKTYSLEEIFEDDPANNENVLMKIPEDIAKQMGWQPGDVLKINILETGGLSITKVDNGKE